MSLIFFVFSTLFFISHSLFFLRAVYYTNKKFTVQNIDRITRTISLLTILPTAILGSISLHNLLKSIITYMPIMTILLSNFNKNIIKAHSFLLPLLNFIFALIIFIFSLESLIK